jgi:hypothetical protein
MCCSDHGQIDWIEGQSLEAVIGMGRWTYGVEGCWDTGHHTAVVWWRGADK